VADRVLLVRLELGRCAPEVWQQEIRVMPEATGATRGVDHFAVPAALRDQRLVALVLDIDRMMTADQRSRLVARFESYAEDCRILARQGRPAGDTRAAIAPEGAR